MAFREKGHLVPSLFWRSLEKMAFREEACLVPWQIRRFENLTDKLTSRKFAKLWNREKKKQISFERYIWMIAKTEIANDSKIRLRFENLTGKKTIRKFVICQ